MYRSQKAAFVFGVLTALLWSPHFHALESLRQSGVSVLAAQFHGVFWAALALLLLLFLSGRISDLSIFNRRETHFLVLAAVGGYGFWLLRGLAFECVSASHARRLFYTAPLFIWLMSAFTREKADRRTLVGLLLGFVGCIVIMQGQDQGAQMLPTGGARGTLLALGAAACWALFAVSARPLAREGNALPVAALVTSIGAACLLVTCLSTGEDIFRISLSQLAAVILSGVFTVGLMMVLWLKCLGNVSAVLAAPFWYLGLLFGMAWAYRAGQVVSGWWVLCGAVLILLGLHSAASGRQRSPKTIGDIIRG